MSVASSGAVLRHVDRVGQRRTAERRQVHRQLDVPRDAQRRRDGPRRLDLAAVPLPVGDGQRVQLEPLGPGDRGRGGRVEPAAEEHDGTGRWRHETSWRATLHDRRQTPRVAGPQMYLCTCSCSRTGSRSASIQAARSAGPSTPCTGENSTCAHARRPGRGAPRPPSRTRSRAGRRCTNFTSSRGPQPVEVRPVDLRRLAAARALHVHDPDDAVGTRSSDTCPPVSSSTLEARGRAGAASAGRRRAAGAARRRSSRPARSRSDSTSATTSSTVALARPP